MNFTYSKVDSIDEYDQNYQMLALNIIFFAKKTIQDQLGCIGHGEEKNLYFISKGIAYDFFTTDSYYRDVYCAAAGLEVSGVEKEFFKLKEFVDNEEVLKSCQKEIDLHVKRMSDRNLSMTKVESALGFAYGHVSSEQFNKYIEYWKSNTCLYSSNGWPTKARKWPSHLNYCCSKLSNNDDGVHVYLRRYAISFLNKLV